MKKILSFSIVCFVTIVCPAQIQVASTGNVGIGDTLTTDKKVFVSTTGVYEAGIYSYIKSSHPWGFALLAKAEYSNDRQIAIRGYASNPSPTSSGRSYGVMGVAGNRTSGYNYGVCGGLDGMNNGAGIYGTTSSLDAQINGRFLWFPYMV